MPSPRTADDRAVVYPEHAGGARLTKPDMRLFEHSAIDAYKEYPSNYEVRNPSTFVF